MDNTYLQQLLRILTKHEWKVLGDFLASPYFNKNAKFIRFYKLLDPYYPLFDVDDNAKVKLYIKTTDSSSFSDAGYRNLCSDFLALLNEFITQEEMKERSSVKDQYLNTALLNRKALDLVEKNLRKIEQQFSKGNYAINEQFLAAIWINDARLRHNIYSNRKSLQLSQEYMSNDQTYLVVSTWSLIKIFTALINYITASRSLHKPIDNIRVNAFLHLYETLQPFQNAEVEMFYLIVKINVTNDENYYFKLKAVFTAHIQHTRNKSTDNIIIGMLDFCNYKVAYDERWRAEVFQLYNLKFTKQIWDEAKGLSYASLFNSILNALQMGEITYAQNILSQYINFVDKNIQVSLINLCNAYIAFFTSDYELAHERLVAVESENLLIKFELRSLQCLIYLQKQAWDLLSPTIESFRQFVAYNKNIVPGDITTQYTHFQKQIFAIAKLHPAYKRRDCMKIIEQLELSRQSYFRKWMLEKVASFL